MVLYDNVFPGQRVEVRWNDGIYKGVVRYKGPIATKHGEWVGVALEQPVGDSCGLILGRRYFQCRPNYGVFVRSDRLRFIPSLRCLYDKYHRVSRNSYIEEHLFNTPRPEPKNGPHDPIAVAPHHFNRVRSSLADYDTSSMWDKPIQYNLRHSVGNNFPTVAMLRAETANIPFRYHSRPIHADYWYDDDFERKPSIPKTHMPLSALKKQVQKGWHGAHYVREMTVPTGREKMKFSQWNDISP